MQHNMIAVKNIDILQEFNTLSYNHTIKCYTTYPISKFITLQFWICHPWNTVDIAET